MAKNHTTVKSTAAIKTVSHRAAPSQATTTENAPTPAASAAPQTATATSSVLLVAPPPETSIPSVPADFVPVSGADYRGFAPKSGELAVMPEAVKELQGFADFTGVFGKTAPPYAAVVQTFDIANQWSAVRTRLNAFDVYCATQENLAWKDVHAFMDRMKPAFELAVRSDGSVATSLPSLSRLFSVQKVIAQKGVTTRKENKKLEAEGKMPIKGTVGKRRKKAAANALLAAATAPPQAAVTASAPATTTATPVAEVAPLATNGATPAVPAQSGTAHS